MEYCIELHTLPQIALAGHSVCRPGWSLCGRTLEESELIVVYRGQLCCNVGGEAFVLREGESCVIPAGTPVDQFTENTSCRFFYLHFKAPCRPIRKREKEAILTAYAESVANRPGGFFFLNPIQQEQAMVCLGQRMDTASYKSEIFTLFQRLLLERNHETMHSALLISLQAAQILTLLAQCWMAKTVPLTPSPEEREQNKLVQDAILYLNEHLTAPVKMTELAQTLHVSQQYLARLFKTETGLSPVKYLNRLRIEHAKELMRKSSMNITEAALSSGFDNLYYFSRLFKQLEGMTPSVYRAWMDSKSNQ